METQPDLVRPYVAQLGESATEPVAPPVTWAEAGPEPAPGGRSGHRGAGRRRRIRPGVVAVALVVAVGAAAILASTLGGSGANSADPGSGPAAVLPTASATAPRPGQPMQSGPSGQSGGTSGTGASPSATSGAQQTGRPASSATATVTVPHPAAATAQGGSADGTLRPGDRGPAVARLQQLLFDQGFTYVAVTGVYDDATTRGVTQLQQNRDLTADPPGVYGPQSRASLDPGN